MMLSEKDNTHGGKRQDANRLLRIATSLLKAGGPLQSNSAVAPVSDSKLRASLEAHLKIEEANLATQEGRDPSDTAPIQAASDIVRTGRNALKRFENGASASSLTDNERNALQAIIEVTGRPALRYVNGEVQTPPSDIAENEHWHVFIAVARKYIDAVSRSVGRVVIEKPYASPEILGTAWRLGDALVVTNRHVAARLVGPGTSDPSQWALDQSRIAAIDFAATDGKNTPSRWPIVSLEYCAPEQYVDLAVFRLGAQGSNVPVPLNLDTDPDALGTFMEIDGMNSWLGAEVYVVGHPFHEDSSREIKSVFGRADGKKRCSPGYITRIGTEIPVLEHDCSTLSGNSGSCVMSRARHRVVGIHFGSRGTDEVTGLANTNLAVALTRLGDHPAAQILHMGRINGKP